MTQYINEVEKQRLYLAAEDWGNKVSQIYSTKGGAGDLGFGMGMFVYYNNGAVHKLEGKKISICQIPNSIEQVIDDYDRKDV